MAHVTLAEPSTIDAHAGPSTTRARVVAHLVPGTWPSGGYLTHKWPVIFRPKGSWFQSGSEFRRRIELAVPGIEWRIFNWSGDNSELARRRAAGAFADRMREHLAADPEGRHIVIAHSHGGNVALWGLGQLSEAEQEKIAGVATMGTPFLHFVKRQIPALEQSYLDLLTIGQAFMLVGFLFVLVVMLISEAAASYIGVPMATTVGLAIAVAGLIWLWRYRERFTIRVDSELERPPPCPDKLNSFLVLRSHGDEASRVIALASIAARALTLFWFLVRTATTLMPWTNPRWRRNVLGVAFAAVALLTAITWVNMAMHSDNVGFCSEDSIPHGLTYGECLAGWVIFTPFLLAFFVALLTAMVSIGTPYAIAQLIVYYSQVFLRLALGDDIFFLAITTSITAEAYPMCPVTEVEYVDAGDVKRRHSVYAMPAARSRLATWISERQRPVAC